MQRIGDELADIVESERRQHDLLDSRSGFADSIERAPKRVSGTDLVVPVDRAQQQVPHFRVRNQMLKEVERCCVQPLQIIEEQSERVLLAGKRPEEAAENHLEAVLGVLRRKVPDRWLFPNHELQLGNQVDDELTIRAEHLAQGFPPAAKLLLALGKERADEALEGLAQGRVRDVALVLVELAGREQA